MSTLRNRRSSLHEPRYTSFLYRGRSDFSGISSAAGSTPSKRDSLRHLYSTGRQDSLSSFKSSSSSDFASGRGDLGRHKSSSTERLFRPKEKAVSYEPLTTRPLRRRSESADYRIGAHRSSTSDASSIRDIECRLAHLSSSCSLTKTPSSSSTVRNNETLTRTASSRFSRSTSRSTSFESVRDVPSFESRPSEPVTKFGSLKRSLSGRLSGSLLSPASRQSPTKTIRANSSTEVNSSTVRRGSGVCGIQNLGNSCYQNSVIQFLNAIPEFVNCLRDAEDSNKNSKIAAEMSRLLHEVSCATDNTVVDIVALRRRLGLLDRKWVGYGQEDAHEFLTQIISALQEDCNRNPTKPKYIELEDRDNIRLQAREEWKYSKQWNDSEIDDIFGFQLHNQITCPACKHQTHRFGYLTSLEVPLPETSLDLQTCLQDFTGAEMLDKENVWQCPKCKESVQAIQQLRLSRLPKVLIVCLKRFGSARSRFSTFRSWKNTVPVRLPFEKICLQDILSPTADVSTSNNAVYELVSIVDHSGSVNFGHYTARVKNSDRDTWYMMNDEIVRPIGQPVGPSESAYILALRRVETSG